MACQKSHDVKKIFEDKINHNEGREPQYFVYNNEEQPSKRIGGSAKDGDLLVGDGGIDENKVGWRNKDKDLGMDDERVKGNKVEWGNKKYDQDIGTKGEEGREIRQRKYKEKREREGEEGENNVEMT